MGCTAGATSQPIEVIEQEVFTAEGQSSWQKSGAETFSEVSAPAEYIDAASGYYSSENKGYYSETSEMSPRGGVKVVTTEKERRERQIMLKNKRWQKEIMHKSGSATFSEGSSAADTASGYYSSENSEISVGNYSRGVKVGNTEKERRERRRELKNKRWRREMAGTA